MRIDQADRSPAAPTPSPQTVVTSRLEIEAEASATLQDSLLTERLKAEGTPEGKAVAMRAALEQSAQAAAAAPSSPSESALQEAERALHEAEVDEAEASARLEEAAEAESQAQAEAQWRSWAADDDERQLREQVARREEARRLREWAQSQPPLVQPASWSNHWPHTPRRSAGQPLRQADVAHTVVSGPRSPMPLARPRSASSSAAIIHHPPPLRNARQSSGLFSRVSTSLSPASPGTPSTATPTIAPASAGYRPSLIPSPRAGFSPRASVADGESPSRIPRPRARYVRTSPAGPPVDKHTAAPWPSWDPSSERRAKRSVNSPLHMPSLSPM